MVDEQDVAIATQCFEGALHRKIELDRTLARATGGDDLSSRIDFLLEIDKLKSVMRRSRLVDGS